MSLRIWISHVRHAALVYTVSRIFSQAKKPLHHLGMPLFRAPGKHHNVPKGVTSIHVLERDVLCRTVFEFYRVRQLPTA
jgi:hypothetical protein